MNIVYVAAFSQENVALSKKFCDQGSLSRCLLWDNPILQQTKEDYAYLIGNHGIEEKYHDQIFLNDHGPSHRYFQDDINEFISSQLYEPEAILIRGEIPQIWPLSLLCSALDIRAKCCAMLERLVPPVDEFDHECLEVLDLLFAMGPSANHPDYKDKTIQVFKGFESFYYQKIPDFLEYAEVETPLVACNSINYQDLSARDDLKAKGASFINVDECQDEENVYFGWE